MHGPGTIAEQQLNAALESMSDGFALFDSADRMVVYNRRFVEFFPFLSALGDLRGRRFEEMVAAPGGEWALGSEPERLVAERMERHRAADGRPFDIPLDSGGWARVRERATPDGGIVSTWSDITELKAVEQQLLDAIASISEGFVLLDAEGRVRLCNERLRMLLGDTDGELVPGASFEACLHASAARGRFARCEDDGSVSVALIVQALAGQQEGRVEIPLGDERWVLAGHRRMADGGTVSVWTDLTVQKMREAELLAVRAELERQTATLADLAQTLTHQAHHDTLTDLPNRFALEEQLNDRLGKPGALYRTWLLFIDLDHFKSVNDMAGHSSGDEVLRQVAAFLAGELRPEDMLARFGGDEFAVLLNDADEEDAISVAARLNAAAQSQAFLAAGRSFTLGLSIGIAGFDPSLPNVSSLLAAADAACYAAKDAGRSRSLLHHAHGEAPSSAELTLNWAGRIRQALDENGLRLHLQPIVDINGRTVGFEALIRLMDAVGTLHPPGAFLPAARRLGLMAQIDEWVCRTTIQYAQRLRAQRSTAYISMNFGASTLSDPMFHAMLLRQLDRNPGLGPMLRIELTETDKLDNPDGLARFLATLRQRGLKLYLDDFGSGYNSFDLLKRLQVDGIKIDWTVTRDPLDGVIDLALIRAAVTIANSLGLELVAEGVERATQLDNLRALGITQFQGYHFRPPEDAEAALAS